MNKEHFLAFVEDALKHDAWQFAKSVPNWPHFYLIEKDLPDQAAFRAAKAFVREAGRVGKFFNMDVIYCDAEGWTYWASPLAEPPEFQYMLNRCKTEYTYESCARAGELPPEGFRESKLSLAPIREDAVFISLMRELKGAQFTVFDVLGTSDYEIRHSNVLWWLVERSGNHGQNAAFLELLWKDISADHELPNLPFRAYSVIREGGNEAEKTDLLIKAENLEWVIVIENKLFSPETGDQLDRYFKHVEHQYSKVPYRFYFYLTPDGIAPAKDEDSRNWRPISYLAVTRALSQFLQNSLPDRVRGFLEQYLEHIEKNVLRSAGAIEKQRGVLKRHAKIFHSLEYLLEEEYIRKQCSEMEFELLKQIIAVQREVSRELFEFTKQMMVKYGYTRYSGLGHWITIEPPMIRERLIQTGLGSTTDVLPTVFVFDSRPDSYVVEIWLYKKSALFSKVRGHLSRFPLPNPGANRGDSHLVAVLFRNVIINADNIIREQLSELKDRIAAYFASELKKDLDESVTKIGNVLDSIASHDTQ